MRSSPAWTWFGIVLAIPAAILLLIQAVTGSDDLLPYSSAFEAVLYFYAAGALIAYMLADHDVTRDELFAVGATFTLVAWAFAYTFTVLQAIEPGSFTAAVDPNEDRTWMELLFLSFTTLSSTGLSDVIPIKPFARSVVMLEQLAGVAYIAMVVSRLVGLTVLRRAGASAASRTAASQARRCHTDRMADVVNLRVGDEHELRLKGLATAGYRWVPAVEDDAVAESRSRTWRSSRIGGSARAPTSSSRSAPWARARRACASSSAGRSSRRTSHPSRSTSSRSASPRL